MFIRLLIIITLSQFTQEILSDENKLNKFNYDKLKQICSGKLIIRGGYITRNNTIECFINNYVVSLKREDSTSSMKWLSEFPIEINDRYPFIDDKTDKRISIYTTKDNNIVYLNIENQIFKLFTSKLDLIKNIEYHPQRKKIEKEDLELLNLDYMKDLESTKYEPNIEFISLTWMDRKSDSGYFYQLSMLIVFIRKKFILESIYFRDVK